MNLSIVVDKREILPLLWRVAPHHRVNLPAMWQLHRHAASERSAAGRASVCERRLDFVSR